MLSRGARPTPLPYGDDGSGLGYEFGGRISNIEKSGLGLDMTFSMIQFLANYPESNMEQLRVESTEDLSIMVMIFVVYRK